MAIDNKEAREVSNTKCNLGISLILLLAIHGMKQLYANWKNGNGHTAYLIPLLVLFM